MPCSREAVPATTRRSTGAAMRAARGAVLQPSLLRSLSRPSETEHIPAWAARVRERLGVVEAQLRRLEREKQTLLGQLVGAPSALVDAVLNPSRSPAERSPIRHEPAVSSAAAPVSAVRPDLWEAAGGDSTARLRAAAQNEGERVHPALAAAASAQDSPEPLIEITEEAKPEHVELAQVASPARSCTGSQASRSPQSTHERIVASPSPARCRGAIDPIPQEGAAAVDDVAPTAADDTAGLELLSSESPARPPERLDFSPAARVSEPPCCSPCRSPSAAVASESPANFQACLPQWTSPPSVLTDGATRLARLLGRDLEVAEQPVTGVQRENRSPSVAPTILSSSEDEAPQAEVKLQDAEPMQEASADSSPLRPRAAGVGLLERIRQRQSSGSRDSDAPLAGASRDDDTPPIQASRDSDAPLVDVANLTIAAPAPRSLPEQVQQCPASSSSCSGHLCPQDLEDEALKKWMSFFGMKAVSSRSFMVKRLLEIDAYLNGVPDGKRQDEEAGAAEKQAGAIRGQGRGRGRGRPKKRPLAAAVGEEVALAGPEVKAARPTRSDAAVEPAPLTGSRSVEGEVEPSPKLTGRAARAAEKAEAVEQLVADVIRRDTELYERMLLFEPIEIGELRERLSALEPELRGLSEQRLRKFLDAQGLVFANGWQGRENVHHNCFR